MPGALFRSTLLIAFALCLVCSATCRAQPPPAHATPQDEAGAPPRVILPKTFICGPPASVPPSGETPRPIPPGRQIGDLCPPGAYAYLFYDPVPGIIHLSPVSHLPPPVDLEAARLPEAQPDASKKTP